MIKIFLHAVAGFWLLATSLSATAQTSEISFSAGGGISGLSYTIKNGKTNLQPGYQAGIGFTRFFNSHWDIATGLELGYYHSDATLVSNTVFATHLVDTEGDAFEFRVKTSGYKEKQKVYAVNIPLMLQFQAAANAHTQWYARGGAKFGIPFSARYQAHATEITATGYYPDLNIEITDLPAHGFGTQHNWSGKGDNDLKLSFSLAAETGVRFRLSPRNQLYAGAYIDYGLNNMKKEEGTTSLLTYNPAQFNQSQAAGVFSLVNTTGNIRLIAYGVKLRIGFNTGKLKRKQEIIPAPPPISAPAKEAEKQTQPKTVVVEEKPVQQETPRDTLTAEEDLLLKTPIRFSKPGDTTLSSAAKTHLDKIAGLLQHHPDMKLDIEGHTCDLGNEAANQRVGSARAEAATAYLETRGIAASRIRIVSRADLEPLVPNTSEANRKQNRRVVFKVKE